MNKDKLVEEIRKLEESLDNNWPGNWEDKCETHEQLYELFEGSFDMAYGIAMKAIDLLKQIIADAE